VFCGKYLTDCRDEYPASWFARAKLSPSGRDCSLNYFGVDASQPLSEWRRKGWMHADDPRGWFQWYCRYYMGRRLLSDARRAPPGRARRPFLGSRPSDFSNSHIRIRTGKRQSLAAATDTHHSHIRRNIRQRSHARHGSGCHVQNRHGSRQGHRGTHRARRHGRRRDHASLR
jgi:hypothetical protein